MTDHDEVFERPSSASLPKRVFPADTVLVRQGETGCCAWLIESGELEILIDESGVTRRVAVVGSRAVIGEMALIDHGPRTATVRTLTAVVAVEIDRSLFDLMLSRAEPLITYLFESMLGIIRRTYHLSVPERKEGSVRYRSTAANDRILKREVAEKGRVFYREGEHPATAFLIQSGAVSLRRHTENEPIEIALIGPGRVFGGFHFIDKKAQPMTAVAVEQTVCERIDEAHIAQAVAALPPIMQLLLHTYASVAREQLAALDPVAPQT